MKSFKTFFATALMAAAVGTAFSACSDNDDVETTKNPAEIVVSQTKAHDTAILLCTFGSTYNESLKVYDDIMDDYKKAFPETDVYMSFTSRTCILRAEATTGVPRYKLKQWLEAIGHAGYKRVAVQSLHVIPGEEYLSLMNTDVKKNFMIEEFPHIDVLKGANLLADDNDTKLVADAVYNNYKKELSDPKTLVLLIGHGNPDDNYNANQKYVDMEQALQAKAAQKNIFVGTVDYGEMLFWPYEETAEEEGEWIKDANEVVANHPACVYSKIMNYCQINHLKPEEVRVILAPFMSIAGDHAHNDLWGLEAIAEGDNLDEVKLYTNEYSWRERLEKIGFKVDRSFESHPLDQGKVDADHGLLTGCDIKALGSYPEIRKIWVEHLSRNWNDAAAWTNGEDYQLEE